MENNELLVTEVVEAVNAEETSVKGGVTPDTIKGAVIGVAGTIGVTVLVNKVIKPLVAKAKAKRAERKAAREAKLNEVTSEE